MAHKYLLPLSACCHQGYLSRISELVQNWIFTLRLTMIRKLNMQYVICNRRHCWKLCISYTSFLYPGCARDSPDILLKYPWQSPVMVLLPPLGPVMMLEVRPQGRGWPRPLPPDPLHELHLPRTDPGAAAGQLPMSLTMTMTISVGGAAGGVTGVGGDRPGHLHWGVAQTGQQGHRHRHLLNTNKIRTFKLWLSNERC